MWASAKRMHDALAGRVVTRSQFRIPRLAGADLRGRTVTEVRSRGKHMLTRLDSGLTLHTHFRMDGSWRLTRPGHRARGAPDWQVRVVIGNLEWDAIGCRLPVINLVPTSDEGRFVGHLGPDLLGTDWDAARAVANLLQHPDAQLGLALLDQTLMAGLGNLYRCELCFLHGVSPWTMIRDVPDLPALVERAHLLISANRDRPEQSTTGGLRRHDRHWVFERTRQPCRVCGTPIGSAEQGTAPRTRITYWCRTCQPSPRATSRRQSGTAG